MDNDGTGQGYLEHLTDEDLRVLADSAGLDREQAGELRRSPARVLELADRAELFDRVFGADDPARLVRLSPFLAFLAAVGQARREIAATPYVAERSAPRQVVPVFDAAQLAEFLADPRHRLFLAELLASFVRVASGRFWTTRSGTRSGRSTPPGCCARPGCRAEMPPSHRSSCWSTSASGGTGGRPSWRR